MTIISQTAPVFAIIHVVDLARAHVAALAYLDDASQSIPYDVFNIGTGKGHSVLEVLASLGTCER